MRLLLILVALQAAIVLSSYTEDELEDTVDSIMESKDGVDEETGLTLEDVEEVFMETERQGGRCPPGCRIFNTRCRCPPPPSWCQPPNCRFDGGRCVCVS